MKKTNGFISILLLTVLMLISSCRQEEYAYVGTPPEQSLSIGSTIISLLQGTTSNDGSADNLIDQASCFSVQLPVSVIVNGTQILVEDQKDYEVIELIFDEYEDDEDTLEIIFPITIIMNDFSTNAVLNAEELSIFRDGCPEENEADDDIECVDIQYPITASIFNSNSEIIDTISFMDDMSFNSFLNNLTDDDFVSLNFPITLLLHDGTSVEVSSIVALENVIEDNKDACDEDDDNDFNDDDCIDCTTTEFLEVWAECSNWEAHLVEIDGESRAVEYSSYVFTFQEDGSVLAVSDTETIVGTWVSSSANDKVFITITVPGLDNINGLWELQEIKRTLLDTDVRLIAGENKVHFRSICLPDIPVIDPIDPIVDPVIDIVESLTTGVWGVSNYLVDGINQLPLLGGNVLTFDEDGGVVGSGLLPLSGTWVVNEDSTEMTLDFGLLPPLNLLNADWEVVSVSETQIELQHVGLLGIVTSLVLTQ